jgi:hypothetical protein
MGSGTRAFNAVFQAAQVILRDTFGMELVELQKNLDGDDVDDGQEATGAKKKGEHALEVIVPSLMVYGILQPLLLAPRLTSCARLSIPPSSNALHSPTLPFSRKSPPICPTRTTTTRSLFLAPMDPSSRGLARTTSALSGSSTSCSL